MWRCWHFGALCRPRRAALLQPLLLAGRRQTLYVCTPCFCTPAIIKPSQTHLGLCICPCTSKCHVLPTIDSQRLFMFSHRNDGKHMQTRLQPLRFVFLSSTAITVATYIHTWCPYKQLIYNSTHMTTTSSCTICFVGASKPLDRTYTDTLTL